MVVELVVVSVVHIGLIRVDTVTCSTQGLYQLLSARYGQLKQRQALQPQYNHRIKNTTINSFINTNKNKQGQQKQWHIQALIQYL